MLLRALWTWTSIWAITGTVFLGVWSVMLGQNDFTSAVWAVGIALALLVAKGMSWVQEHHIPSKQKRSARLLIAVVACAIFVLHCFYIQGKKSRSEALHVMVRLAMASDGPPEATMFWSVFNGPHGQQITPANVLVWLEIANRSKDPMWISTIEADYESSWFEWKPLYAIPGSDVYSTFGDHPALTSMLRIELLAGESPEQISVHPLDPEKAYPVVAVFQFPPGYQKSHLRIKVCDLDNDCSISRLSDKPPVPGNSHTVGGEFYVQPPPVDLSHLYVSLWANQ